MSQVIKVFTPIKRVPTMVGKAQNGQKLPFGPYTLPQIGSLAGLLLVTGICAMTMPMNPAVTFGFGLILTVAVVFLLGLVPYTGVRMSSRAWWLLRVAVVRKPVSASGVPIDADSARQTLFIDESIVLILPESAVAGSVSIERAEPLLAVLGTGSGAELDTRIMGNGHRRGAEGRD
ncbi:hypothetical protein [Nocardia brasiliensis]|uniref:hypothetical protein n=1 Tax=Nocardia brasiliensis TaxID=37326 RepID=UPI0024543D07|nr:hypothetical protein [Nocardia brasiliensis]